MHTNILRSAVASGALILLALVASPSATAQVGYSYVPVTPCRVVDTRLANGTNGGPILSSGATRDFQMRGLCAVPTAAKAVALTVTSVSPSADGFFGLWPSGQTYSSISNINFVANQPPTANFAIIAISTNTLDLSFVYGANGAGTAHVILDVVGYYQ